MRNPWLKIFGIIIALMAAGLLSASCSLAQTMAQNQPDPLAQAAAEATAIIQRAEASALAVQARAEATALVAQARMEATSVARLAQEATLTQADSQPAPLTPAVETPQSTAAISETLPTTSAGEEVRILRVTLAEETQYIYVQYLAPPAMAQRWNQTSVYIEDMESGTRYAEVPFMPLIGPLFNRPAHAGQSGFFMIINLPTPLAYGDRVRVKLGNYFFEDLLIER